MPLVARTFDLRLDEASVSGVKVKDSRYIELANTGYPCVVTGALSFKLAIHPTHGHHSEYERTGKPPANIMKPIISDKQLIPFARVSINNSEVKEADNGNNIIHTETGRFDLNKEGASDEGEGEEQDESAPVSHPDAEKLEGIFSKGYSDLAPSALIPDGWVAADPLAGCLPAEVRGVLVELININCGKQKAVELVFGVTKGGNNKYKAARYWYEEVRISIKGKK